MAVFNAVRSKWGEARTLIEAPGHLFDGDSDQALAQLMVLLILMMAFNWEGYFFTPDGRCSVWFADEIVEIWTSRGEWLEQVRQDLVEFGLESHPLA